MDEVKSLLHAIMERLDVQSANIEQMKADLAKLSEGLLRVETRVEELSRQWSETSETVEGIQKEIISLKQTQKRFDEQLLKEEDWQKQIMQALSLTSGEREKTLKKGVNKSAG
ncbi:MULTISPECIES: hypothetical protein [Thermoactinomyces]|jgi:archaellum component FlaC|uniref:Uncharacterized protein n=1 Tax=Thermoactinomyces daqus TaxID=1329516 RepID=A0A7W1XA53_9BACL|nr:MULTISPECIES: hypothetical protein [Thermoactinomyces]MBA4542842.1 hypothetical protein [Thermoactinomyces daqus]MBH8598485.1 hypothetical protein [Thermoactinomyces sp. CICC 10523]MBH8604670.1 hypothetical protein [Thermoactinomyces sp. CICC 10522]MBH8606869.1 hypothetical protein [Thermoactinomyces sp. CICC 10521]